jgi:membrane protein implicated in regulation of membrane protease activity
MPDVVKYWLAIAAIAIGVGLFSGRISSAVIFFIAGGAIYLYWSRLSRQRQRRDDQ